MLRVDGRSNQRLSTVGVRVLDAFEYSTSDFWRREPESTLADETAVFKQVQTGSREIQVPQRRFLGLSSTDCPLGGLVSLALAETYFRAIHLYFRGFGVLLNGIRFCQPPNRLFGSFGVTYNYSSDKAPPQFSGTS